MWDLSKPGIKPVSSTLADVLEHQGSPQNEFLSKNNILRIARICYLLEVPWLHSGAVPRLTKETSPGCSLEGLMLKLKLQYFGHLRQRVDSLEKTLMLGRVEGRRRGGRQRMR